MGSLVATQATNWMTVSETCEFCKTFANLWNIHQLMQICVSTAWMQYTIINWAANGANVCAVDWGPIAKEYFNYFKVAQVNTVRVAEYLAKVLLHLEQLGVVLADTTLAGHSLGAQIAGKVGAKLHKSGRELGEIYGQSFHYLIKAHLGYWTFDRHTLQVSTLPGFATHCHAMRVSASAWIARMHCMCNVYTRILGLLGNYRAVAATISFWTRALSSPAASDHFIHIILRTPSSIGRSLRITHATAWTDVNWWASIMMDAIVVSIKWSLLDAIHIAVEPSWI